MSPVISVENLSKVYHLGQIGTGTFTNDLKVWWARARGKPNPLLRIGQQDHGNLLGEDLWALRDVSFTVEQGEVLGIIGRNGAGKSTLLKILSRVTAPTSGRIRVRGRIASLLEVGTGFHPELTGRENVYLNGAILGMTRTEVDRKFDEIVDFSGVERFIDTPVKRYSSGMYVRLAFAVAAHLDPEILVVDEVLAVGDAEFQKKCLGKMGDVAHEGRTVLFVSHNMSAIRQITNRSILLASGTIIEDGDTEYVIKQYLEGTHDLYKQKELIDNRFLLMKEISYIIDSSEKKDLLTPLQFLLKNKFKIKCNLSITLGINNSLGNRVLTSWANIDVNSDNIGNLQEILLTINEPRLPPGSYSLMIGFRINKTESYVINDYLTFTIPPDYFDDFHLVRLGDRIGTFCPLNIDFIMETFSNK